MAIKWKKFWKRYERAFLIGLVVVLLATFSIAGAFSGCADERGGSRFNMGGTFNVSPTQTRTLSNEEFDAEYASLESFQMAAPVPTIEFLEPLEQSRARVVTEPAALTWSNIVLREAAENAGYRVGKNTAKAAAREIVQLLTRMPVNDASYQEYLDTRYRGRAPEFLDHARGISIRDAFIAPLVGTARYAETYDAAYESWKYERQRLDIEYVALPAAPFIELVEKEERTRATITERERELTMLTTATDQVRTVMATVESVRDDHAAAAKKKAEDDGAEAPEDDPAWWPASLDELVEKNRLARLPSDPWGNELRYTVSDEGDVDLRSAGRDGELDTGDDITPDVRRQLLSHGNLKEMARAVLEWRRGRGAWPEQIEDVLTPAKEGAVAPLRELKVDGFDRPFRYEIEGEGPPTLFATGPDGAADTEDDFRITLAADTSRSDVLIPIGEGLIAVVGDSPDDAWGRPLGVFLDRADPIRWSVPSAGADGTHGTDDDVSGGNEQALLDFFQEREVRDRHRLPVRRQFEALFVHLPLLPDDVLAKLWADFPDQHPDSEDQLYQNWLAFRGEDLIYRADDPADGEAGHGAEAANAIAPDATKYLVPDKDIFPEDLDAAAAARAGEAEDDDPKDDDPKDDDPKDDDPKDDDPKDDDPKDDDPKDDDPRDDDPKDDDPVPDPNREIYETKGWREILIRQRFVENVLATLLSRVIESEKAIEEWEEVHGNAPDDAPIVRPERVSFETLLAGELNPYLVGAADQANQTFRYFVTKKPDDAEGDEWGLTREEWEADPELGDDNLTVFLGSRTGAAGYVTSPIQIRGRTTKALVRNIEYFPARDRTLDEVRDAVFDEYLVKRQTERAVTELDKLLQAAPRPRGDQSVEDVEEAWRGALADWGERHGMPYVVERTGLFIVDEPPVSIEVDDDDHSADAELTRRRNFVWHKSGENILPAASESIAGAGAPGSFGSQPVADAKPVDKGGTASAYLFRVAGRVFPSKYEFSPRRYADHLSEVAFAEGEEGAVLSELKGTFFQALSQFLGDRRALLDNWHLEPNSPLPDVEDARDDR